MKDYYALLGIETNATKKEIRKNYHLLATKFHPDKNPNPNSAAKFITITEAYDVLSNPKSRTQYDLKRWEALKQSNTSSDSFTTIVPPTESLRTRRDKAQLKRSLTYHQTQSKLKLLIESLHIISRYILHIFGVTLMLVLLISALSQLAHAFESSLGTGIGVTGFSMLLGYGIFKLVQMIYIDMKRDILAFSIFYKIPYREAALYSLSAFLVAVLLLISIMLAY